MSFRLLKQEIINPGLCQGCGLCTGSCKHLIMEDLKPTLDDFCIMERDGEACGKCYSKCPQIRLTKVSKETPLDILALKSTDEDIHRNAVSGGFVTTLNKYLLESGKVKKLVEVQSMNGRPVSVITSDPNDVRKYSGVSYGRSGVLEKMVEVLGDADHGPVGIVGVPCEIRGAKGIEDEMNTEIFKIGLFCNANIRGGESEEGEIYSPCRRSCPAGVDASGYINEIRQGNFQEAVDLIREMNPLPSICGRVCTHECEYNCTLIGTNHPIAIRELKKYITDWEMEHGRKIPIESGKSGNKKVAIIGSGPAGLTASYYLAQLGYKPTIFEKSDKTGGMLRFGVPKFRLPDEVLDYDVEFVKQAGVDVKLNSPIGPDLTFEDLKNQGYEAIFLAVGQYQPLTLKLEGEDLPNVHTAVEFLVDRKYRYWENLEEFKDKTVGILGGGPVAIDVAQTAIRLGAKKAIMVEIRSEEQLKMAREEIPAAEMPFIEYKYDTSTKKFSQTDDGRLVFNCHKVSQQPGENGRTNFEKIEGSEYSFDVDAIVIAIGQTGDLDLIDQASGSKLEKDRSKIKVDEITFETNLPGIFAGGDIIVRGKNVAVAAIAHGREAATSIDRYLRGQDLKEGRINRSKMFFHPILPPKDKSKKPPTEEIQTIWRNFEEIDGIFDESMAIKEANRCFNCNRFCSHCQDFAAIHADITAGEIGSEKDFTTVVIWTKRAQRIVQEMLKADLLVTGVVSKEAVDLAIDKKMKRRILEHSHTPREKIYNWLKLNGSGSISTLGEKLDMKVKDVRFNALRLVQKGQLVMAVEADEPIFSLADE
ncbi:FAD-dependent oxidoreductase [Candidatus Lokiarchaeum ossiferum]|uniref:FAD-dependent oxidoreductase n=1 Tax=Candidatus Lokiarchaeum ossiferum TaxID=2951803 RepID=UPI00352D7170